MKQIRNIVLIAVFCWTWAFVLGEEVAPASDETVAAEPLPVVPQKSPPQGQVGPNPEISSTTYETKNTGDGSTFTTQVTHFKGQGSFPGAHPHPGFPGWAYPGNSPFFYNPWGPPVSPANAAPHNSRTKRATKSNSSVDSKQQQSKEDPSNLASKIANVSSIPFSKRFPAPRRESTAFHYPALPEVYWKTHKRPFVPLFDPEIYGFNEVDGNIKQDL